MIEKVLLFILDGDVKFVIINKYMSKYHKDLTKEQIVLMEKLADIEHQRWSDWQKYLHSKCVEHSDGKGEWVCFPAVSFRRWNRQIETSYKDLSEVEKDSDREQVIRYWNLIK